MSEAITSEPVAGNSAVLTAAFALICGTDTMEPRYFPGEVLYCNPNRPIADGCFVAIELADGLGMVKQLVRRSDEEVVLHQFNPPKDIRLAMSKVKRLYRIVSAGVDDPETTPDGLLMRMLVELSADAERLAKEGGAS